MINHLAYSTMLSLQTEMCFPFEYGFYKNLGIEAMHTVAEIGCGNAAFLKTLSTFFPNPEYHGYDHSHELINQRVATRNRISIKFGSIDDLEKPVDMLILRLIMHQIPERANFISKINEKLDNNAKIIITDSFDEKFQLYPILPIFSNHLINHRNIFSPNTSTRNLKDVIVEEMQFVGFKLTKQDYYYVSSLLPGYKEKYRDYMLATSEITGASQDVTAEIENWYQHPTSYVQMGLFMYCFERFASG